MRIWRHFLRTVVHDKRGVFDPISLGIAGLSAGAGFLFNKFGDKEDKDDPLSGIRQQLQGLASKVPGMVSRQKELIGDIFGEARETGLQDIGEEIRGERGFGATTIEPERRVKLLRELGLGESEALLGAERSGLELEAGILSKVGGFTPGEEEPGFGEELLGLGGEILGTELGFGGFGKSTARKTSTDFTEDEEFNPLRKAKKAKGTITSGGLF